MKGVAVLPGQIFVRSVWELDWKVELGDVRHSYGLGRAGAENLRGSDRRKELGELFKQTH